MAAGSTVRKREIEIDAQARRRYTHTMPLTALRARKYLDAQAWAKEVMAAVHKTENLRLAAIALGVSRATLTRYLREIRDRPDPKDRAATYKMKKKIAQP